MAKAKTKKSVKKRVTISKSGKVMRHSAGRRHLNSKHTRKRLRNLGRKVSCAPGDAAKILRMLGNTHP